MSDRMNVKNGAQQLAVSARPKSTSSAKVRQKGTHGKTLTYTKRKKSRRKVTAVWQMGWLFALFLLP